MYFKKALIAYLILTVFLAGAIVMLIEILAVRMIAPYFGSSIFIWTAVIAVTLLSLALGYFFGGRIADRINAAKALYVACGLSGVYLFIALFIRKATFDISTGLDLRAGALLSCIVLFAAPLFLLGMVSPLAVKLYTQRLEKLGSGVGMLYFFSTSGSFLGTLLAGFLLIPQFGVSRIMLFAANTLIVISLIYFCIFSKKTKCLLFLPFLSFNFFLMDAQSLSAGFIGSEYYKELYKADSFYGRIKIVEINHKERCLIVDGVNQGGINIINGSSQTPYQYVMDSLARSASLDLKRALVIGLGSGVLPNIFSKRGILTDVVEIDPQIIYVYRRYFLAHANKSYINIFSEDGRCFIKKKKAKYDVVMLDIFLGDNLPWHLLTLEALTDIKEILSSHGALVINFVGLPQDAAAAKIISAIHKTLSEVFPYSYVFNSRRSLPKGVRSIFFLACFNKPEFLAPERTVFPTLAFKQEVEAVMRDYQEYDSTKDAFVLTDEYSPLDFYNTKTKEEWRKSILKSAKKTFMLN